MNKIKINSDGQVKNNTLTDQVQDDIDKLDNKIDKMIADNLPLEEIKGMIEANVITLDDLVEMFRGSLKWELAITK